MYLNKLFIRHAGAFYYTKTCIRRTFIMVPTKTQVLLKTGGGKKK
jgi:hypothetical protein